MANDNSAAPNQAEQVYTPQHPWLCDLELDNGETPTYEPMFGATIPAEVGISFELPHIRSADEVIMTEKQSEDTGAKDAFTQWTQSMNDMWGGIIFRLPKARNQYFSMNVFDLL